MIDAYDPHEPWDPPEEYASLYGNAAKGPKLMSSSSGRSFLLGERKVNQLHDLYSAMLTMSDRWFGRFMDKFRELNLAENTLLIFVSDHGHAFGEHGFAGKVPQALYPELTDIVFMMRHPEGKKAGETSDYFASTHDVAPTILSALGIERLKAMEGQNLLPTLEGKEPQDKRSHFTAAYDNYVWARDDRYAMFSRNDFQEPKLYDLVHDPLMNNNIYGSKPDVARHMFQDYIIKDAGGPLPNYDV